MLNTSEMAAAGDDDGTNANLGARDAKRLIDAMDGQGNWSYASRGHRNVPDIRNGTDMIALEPRSRAGTPNMSIHMHGIASDLRRPVILIGAGDCTLAEEPQRLRNLLDASAICRHMHSV